MNEKTQNQNKASVIVLSPGEGRSYPMGRIWSVFKADGEETGKRYSVSEWWLEPNTQGPGAHSHAEDDLFYVIECTMSVLVDGRWINAPKGSFVLAPGGVQHDFENRSSSRAGVLNFFHPRRFREAHAGHSKLFRRESAGRCGRLDYSLNC